MYKKILIGLIIGLLCLSPIAAENWNSFQGGVDHNAYRDEASDFVTNIWTFNMESPIHSSAAIGDKNKMQIINPINIFLYIIKPPIHPY